MGATSYRQLDRGFSLIEMSIIVAILGLIAVAMLTAAPVKKEVETVYSNKDKLDRIEDALQAYANRKGYLPCPAKGTSKPTDSDYGVATDCSAGAVSGVVDHLPTGGVTNNDEIRIGVIPHRTLGLSDEFATDSWGNKYTYATIKKLAVSDGLKNYTTTLSGGVIKIVDKNSTELSEEVVGYVVVSHGKDKKGAYSKTGTIGTACSSGVGALDENNCDWSGSAADATEFVDTGISDSKEDSSYFYDILRWRKLADIKGEEVESGSDIASITRFKVTMGRDFHCALTSNKTIYCWGRNWFSGTLGTGVSSSGVYTPAPIAGGYTDWDSLAEEIFINGDTVRTCAIRAGGRLYCWGRGANGMLGNGGTTNSEVPVEVSGGFTDWVEAFTSEYHACGRRSNGTIYCWGVNSDGRLGFGPASYKDVPTLIAGGFTDWEKLYVSRRGGCAIRAGGRLYCWGRNDRGQLGNGTTTNSLVPVEVSGGFTDWEDVVINNENACAIRAGGRLYCWGNWWNGRIGLGYYIGSDVLVPTEVAGGFTDWDSVDTFGSHVCASRQKKLYCWGKNNDGQIGELATYGSSGVNGPTEVDGGYTDWDKYSTGHNKTCAIRGGLLYCWGRGDDSSQGDGSNTDNKVPTLVSGGFTDWVDVFAGGPSVCAARSNGKLYCWGTNDYGQLGDGGTTNYNTPQEITDFTVN